MDDLNQKINDILSSPDALDTIKGLLSSLGNDAGASEGTPPPAPGPEESAKSGIPGIDADLLLKLAPMLASMKREDSSSNLLRALRPHLKEPRQQRLDEAARLMQLVRLIPLLKDGGILK